MEIDLWMRAEKYTYKNLKYYNCIFDEELNRYNIDNPHKHRVVEARYIESPGHIYNGICCNLEGIIGYVFGLKLKDFDKED